MEIRTGPIAAAARGFKRLRRTLPPLQFIPHLRSVDFAHLSTERACFVCGSSRGFSFARTIPDELADDLNLDPEEREAYDRRESLCCLACENNLRNRQLARAMLVRFADHGESSVEALLDCPQFRTLTLLTIDDFSFGRHLARHPNYCYTDYATSLIPIRNRPDTGLQWPDETFDLVVFADTIEHTPHYRRVLKEIRRVLKPQGVAIFELPIITGRRMRDRAVMVDGRVRHILPPSYHNRGEDDSLVFVEFGDDTPRWLEGLGFKVGIYFFNLLVNDYAFIFVCEKAEKRART